MLAVLSMSGACGVDPFGERSEAARVLKRIAGRDEPPDPIEAEPFHRQQTGGAVRGVDRIEGAAEQPDAHPRPVRRQDNAACARGDGTSRAWFEGNRGSGLTR